MTTNTDGKSLNRRVAEALGYKVITGYYRGNYELFADLFAPDDSCVIRSYQREHPDYGAENAAWDNVPDYEHDLNACARDMTRKGYRFSLLQGNDSTWIAIYEKSLPRIAKGYRSFERRALEPAVAWCKAFLALQEYMKYKSIEETRI